MKNKTKILLAVCLTSTFSSMSLAEAEPKPAFSGNISIANNYVLRGHAIQLDKKGKSKQAATIRGEIEYDFANGFKAGVWGININNDNNDNNYDDNDNAWFEFSAGYAAQVDNIGYEIGYLHRGTEDELDVDFKEIYIGASYADFGLTYYKGLDDTPDYVEASYGVNIEDIDILASIGNARDYTDSVGDQEEGWKVYGIEISKAYEGLDYSLKFTKTSEDDDAFKNQNNTVFSISKSF